MDIPGELEGLVGRLESEGFKVLDVVRTEDFLPGAEYIVVISNCDYDSWDRAAEIKGEALPEELVRRTAVLCIDYFRSIAGNR